MPLVPGTRNPTFSEQVVLPNPTNPTTMTRTELINILRRYLLTDGVAQHALSLIWGQPFDGETEKITPQPISTAPSGQRILLYCQRKETGEGWWQIGMLCPDVRRWIDDDCEPDWLLVQPSFWLPLPAQPTKPNP